VYKAFVYIEDGHGRDYGTLSTPISVRVPASNYFVQAPQLIATPNTSNVEISARFATVPGKVWGAILGEADVATASVARIKAGTSAVCTIADHTILFELQTLMFSSCALSPSISYKALIYAEDTSAQDDGTIAFAVDVLVPAVTTSNTFSAFPVITRNDSVNNDGISLSFNARSLDGRMWAMIVGDDNGNCMTIRNMKYLVGSFCHQWNIPIND